MNQINDDCQVDVSSNPNTSVFWDKKIVKYKKQIRTSPMYLKKNSMVLNELKNKKGRILDIGIGYGYIEKLILQNHLDFKLYGIDISNYAIKSAKKELVGNFKVATVYKIPYKKDLFDFALALDVFEHLPKSKINNALLEIRRVLNSDGTLIVTIPINETKKDKILNGHLRDYSLPIIRNELKKCGYMIRSFKYLYAFKNMYAIKMLVNKLLNLRKPNLIFIVATKL